MLVAQRWSNPVNAPRPRSSAIVAAVGATLLILGPGAVEAARERVGGLDAFIVLDESGSMKPIFGRVTDFLADALVRDYLEPGDYLCLIGFSDAPRVRLCQRISSAAEKENVATVVRGLNVVPQGYTDMGRALSETLAQIERLADPSHQQAILILTDGLNQPPRDSPYFDPLRPDTGGLAPPSRFGPRFLEQVERLASRGHRVHVVGIGTATDARRLAEALGSGHTLLAGFDAAELSRGLGRFWDETVDLVGVEAPAGPWRAGSRVELTVHLRSTLDRPCEVRVSGARVSALESTAVAGGVPTLGAAGLRVTLGTGAWSLAPRQDARFRASLDLPPDLAAGDYRARLTFDQAGAIRFYPGEAPLGFQVPSFWERHGTAVVATAGGTALLLVAAAFYRRRAIRIDAVLEGEAAGAGLAGKPVRFAIGATASIGGGATDRIRLAGLPAKVAVLERRSVDRFSVVSSRPELVPTVPEYRLGEAVRVRLGTAPDDQRVLRFVRARGRARAVRTRPARPTRPAPTSGGAAGGVDFR
jgi:Mg-chelatase subunit ChlD